MRRGIGSKMTNNVKDLFDVKLIKFAGVGVVNTLVGAALMFGLYNLAGASYWLSSLTNYVLTSILSYFLNKKITFGHKGDIKGSFFRFSINIAVCYLLAYGIAKPVTLIVLGGISVRVQENIAMLVGMCLFTGLNYIGQRLFVFDNASTQRKR